MRRSLLLLAFAALAVVPGGAGRSNPVPRLTHVVVIVFENKDASEVAGSGSAPTFDSLARHYASFTDYHGLTHPSLPNYLALVSGSTHGISDDCTDCTVGGPSLADTLEAAGKTWKTYAEGLPGPGWTGAKDKSSRYAKKHVPFLYFRRVLARRDRLARVVPLPEFGRDLAAGRLPNFSLVVPDLCHDMHDCSVATGDAWLKGFLSPLLASRHLARGVIFVVFDESSSHNGSPTIPALAAGPAIRRGSRVTGFVTHYRLLRTIEDAFGLRPLGASAKAAPIDGIWR